MGRTEKSLLGTVERRSLIPIAVRLCGGVDGVVEVSDRDKPDDELLDDWQWVAEHR